MNRMSESYVLLGTVSSANPSRREVRVNLRKGREQALTSVTRIQFVLRDGETLNCKVDTLRNTGADPILVLAPGTTRDNVARMKHAAVNVEKTALGTQTEPKYTSSDLIGIEVRLESDALLGTVMEIIETGANDVLEIEKPGGGYVLLPLLDALVNSIDWDKNRLVVGDITPFVVDDEDSDSERLV